MSGLQIQELIEAGVHFGHRSSRWHPAMAPYIHQKHNKIHVIDLRQTVRGLVRAQHFLESICAAGHEVVFVGTKSQAREVVREQSGRCGMHFCVHRWLGGTLTNFQTIRSRLRRLEELERDLADAEDGSRGKKELATMERERRKIFRNLEGIRNMSRMPGAMITVDIRRDEIAVREARSKGIPVISIVDTDCDPSLVDIPIPGNDDAIRAIRIYTEMVADAVLTGRGSKGDFTGQEDGTVEVQAQGADHEPGKPAEAQAASEATQNSVIQESQGEAEPTATASLGDVASVPSEKPEQADPKQADK